MGLRRSGLAALALAVVMLTSLVAGPVHAYNAPGPRWPGSTIRFHETLPPSYDWSLQRAVAAWNRSGARIRLREVPTRSRAQVTVGFGETYGNSGYATIGRASGAYIRLARNAPLRAEDRVFTGIVIAHEFGHVLGLNHVEAGGCRLMKTIIESACVEGPPGYYRCRWLSRDDVRGAVRLYGGRVKSLPRKYCLREPKPPGIAELRASGGLYPQTAVSLSWRLQRPARKGALVRIDLYDASRCSGDEQAAGYGGATVASGVGRWTADSPKRFPPGDYCVEARVVNSYGLEGPVSRLPVSVGRVPTPVPVIQDVVEYPDEYADYLVRGSLPEDASLEVAVSPAGRCAASLDGAQRIATTDQREADSWLLYGIPPGAWCLSFFAVSNDGGMSPPVFREVVHAVRPEL